jgi:hypothetical protein
VRDSSNQLTDPGSAHGCGAHPDCQRKEGASQRFSPYLVENGPHVLYGFTTMPTDGSSFLTWPWPIISVVVALFTWTVTVLTIIYYNSRPERRERKLKIGAATTSFIIPSSKHHDCSFAKQDELSHEVKQIVVPSHSEVIVDLIIKPLLDFNTTQVYFGFEGNENDRPKVLEYCNRFIVKGHRRHVIPGKGQYEDYTDKYHYYHAVESIQWSKDDVKAMGFKIKTRRPGRYQAKMTLIGDVVACALMELTVRVETEPQHRMVCVTPEHMSRNCAVGIDPRILP